MPDALIKEPLPAMGRSMAAGPDASYSVAAAARGQGKRISANSFKLLTAKLKGGPGAASVPGVKAEDSAEPIDLSREIATPAVSLSDALPPDISSALAAELPVFRPITISDSPPLPLPEQLAESTAIAMHGDAAFGEATVFEAVGIEPEIAGPQALPAYIELPQFRPEEWLVSAPAPDWQDHDSEVVRTAPLDPGAMPEDLSPATETQTTVTTPEPAAPVEEILRLFAAEAPVAQAVQIEPVISPGAAAATEEIMRALSAGDPVALEVPVEPATPPDAATPLENILQALAAEAPAAREAPLETVDTPDGAGLPEEILQTLAVAPSALPEAEPESVIEVQNAVEPEVILDLPPETSAAVEQQPGIEQGQVQDKSVSHSALAGQVVDAMMKTITSAVYAKPSASERAAFLREMASIMHSAADADEIPRRARIEPVIQAAIPAVTQALVTTVAPAAPVTHLAPAGPSRVEVPVTEVLAERIGPAQLLKASQSPGQDDPFALSELPARLVNPKPAETPNADEESGDLALTLLDMMSGGTGSLPHERTLAADTLLRILPRIPVKQLLSVVERVAIMETPPALLVAKLIRDTRPEVVGPLLERCSHISDQDLMNAAPDGDSTKLRMVARRRILSTVLSDFLIAVGEPGVLLTLIRNPGAALSHEAFYKLAEHATAHHGLLAPLATRADLPPPVAFELFWHVPQELRRFIFSRFLTDSEMLNKILRITLATHGNEGGDAMGEGKFPPRESLDAAIDLAAANKIDKAAQAFADLGGIAWETAFRILADRDGEPVTVLLKALGASRAGFEEAITKLRLGDAGVLRPDRNPEELQNIFESLSFNKARILLTYWDWYMRKAGPYAPHN